MPGLSPDTPLLVVDDSLGVRAVVETYLRRLGYQNVVTAGSVEEAVVRFKEQQSEIVFLDIVLGKQSGAEFAAEALALRPFTSIVVCTALPRAHDLVTVVFAEGAQEYLQKPIRFSALRDVIERVARAREEQGHETTTDVTYA